MSSAGKNLSSYVPADLPDASNLRFGIVVSDFNLSITNALLTGCIKILKQQGAIDEYIHIIRVPGAFELPLAAQKLFVDKRPDAVICLGCIIKGETRHNEYISLAVANGIMQLSLYEKRPVIFGVLTTETNAQAKDRSGGKHGNKGIEAAVAAIRMATLQNKPGHVGFRKEK